MLVSSMRILYHLKVLHGCVCGRGLKVYHTSLSFEGNHAQTESLIVLKKVSKNLNFLLFP